MEFIFLVVFIMISGLSACFPETVLTIQDLFRVRGRREYTSFALSMTQLIGVIGIIVGIWVFTIISN